MGQLMEDIVSTANNFAENFKEEGNYDFSIESLELVDEYLDELGDFDLDENAIFNISSMIGCYVLKRHAGIMVVNINGQRRNNSLFLLLASPIFLWRSMHGIR